MVTQNKKFIIQIIGAVLIIVGIIAFFYQRASFLGFSYSPYENYALPLGIIGIVISVIGYALPSTNVQPMEAVEEETEYVTHEKFCPHCGDRIVEEDAKYCRRCGHELN
jgi:ribosomal protein L40E